MYCVSLAIYFCCSKGLVWKTKRQQIIRYLHTTLSVSVALWLVQADITALNMMPIWTIFTLWALAFPLVEFHTKKKSSIEINNIYDIVFAIFVTGILGVISSLVVGWSGIIGAVMLAFVELLLILPPIFQISYFLLYKVCLDANGMQILQETHYNEVIEYVKGFPIWKTIAVALAFCVLVFALVSANCITEKNSSLEWWNISISLVLVTVFFYLLLKPNGVFFRIGIVQLFHLVAEYCRNNEKYVKCAQTRLQDLNVKKLGEDYSAPSTILMVIGESASRDYMSAFTNREHNTTPWLRECRNDEQHFVFFDNAYSCGVQTVPTLERALTEKNQYNNKEFYESCSVVDIAHKMGYTVHWYSNQGHLGAADTPITLVANTSEVAKWTVQKLNTVQYDESLLEFMDEIDPTKNNFVVLHLKGNHVNFINRYPREKTVWGEPGVVDLILNYENSIHYTDSVLHSFFDYAMQKLNLQAMVFFSDHACIPDKLRSPNFNGFGMTRIPLFVYLSDEFKAKHSTRFNALKKNANACVSNDLMYELLCGIFDVESNHFDETNSLASESYKYLWDSVLTNEGRTHVNEDNEKQN